MVTYLVKFQLKCQFWKIHKTILDKLNKMTANALCVNLIGQNVK